MGYVFCGCRDCFETTIASDGEAVTLCAECVEAGCAQDEECQAPDAYGCAEGVSS